MDILLIIIPLILMFASQGLVNSVYKKYKLQKNNKGLTGSEVARKILDQYNLSNVKVLQTSGNLTDHFDPRTNVIKLSEEIYSIDSIAAISIAAHECGHAIQYKEKYTPIVIRGALVPVVGLVTKLGYAMLIIGLIAEVLNFAFIGLILMAGSLLFQLITLPVEFNASKRAKQILVSSGIIDNSELNKVKGMLNTAAMTYLATFFATLLQMLRLLLIITGGRRRN